MLLQILQECKHDVARSVEMYSHQRLPEVQALFELDVNLDNRSGRNGVWRLSFLAASFHIHLWTNLSKAEIVPAFSFPLLNIMS